MIPFPDIPQKLQTEMDKLRNEALKGAFRKGVIACRSLEDKAVNPYRNSRAVPFRNAWDKGWEACRKHEKSYQWIKEK